MTAPLRDWLGRIIGTTGTEVTTDAELLDPQSAVGAAFGSAREVARRRRQPLPLALAPAMTTPPTVALTKTGTSTITTPVTYGGNNPVHRFVGVGPVNINASGYWGQTNSNGTASWFEWSTDAATFDVRLLGLNTNFTLFCDGVRVEDAVRATDASGGAYIYTVTFPTAVPRTFRLFAVNMAFNGVYVPATASVWKPTEPLRPFAWALGDSYTFGTGATVPARSASMGMAALLGLELLPDGVGGTGWNSTGQNVPVTRATRAAGLPRVPDYVFLDLGYNDAGGDMTALAASFDATVTQVRANAPKAKIIAFGPHTPQGTTANLDAVKAAVSARAAAAGIPFVDVANWINANNKAIYTGGDNVHPTQAGHDYLAARLGQSASALLM